MCLLFKLDANTYVKYKLQENLIPEFSLYILVQFT